MASAAWLGIANMRKRKLRTALTGTTVVLITFALLVLAIWIARPWSWWTVVVARRFYA